MVSSFSVLVLMGFLELPGDLGDLVYLNVMVLLVVVQLGGKLYVCVWVC
jgi:hypothetical protein